MAVLSNKTINWFVAVLLLFAILFYSAGCSSKRDYDSSANSLVNAPYYRSDTKEIPIFKDFDEGNYVDIKFNEDRIFCLLNSYTQEQLQCENEWFAQPPNEKTALPVDENGDVCVPDKSITIFDYKLNLINEIDLNKTIGDFYKIPQMCTDTDGNLVVLVVCSDAYTFDSQYYKAVFTRDGELKNLQVLEVDKFYTFFSICCGDDGGLYGFARDEEYENYIIRFDQNGRLIDCSKEAAENCYGLVLFDGNPHCLLSKYTDDMRIATMIIPCDDRFDGNDTNSIVLGYDLPETALVRADDNGLYVFFHEELYWLPNGDRELISIYEDDGRLGLTPCYFYCSVDDKLLIIGNNGLTSTMYLSVVEAADTDPLEDKTPICVAGVNIMSDPYIRNMAFRYNISNEDHYIQLINYDCGEDGSDALEANDAFMKSIAYDKLGGEHIDLIADIYGFFPANAMISSGYLVSGQEGQYGRYYLNALLTSSDNADVIAEQTISDSVASDDMIPYIVNHDRDELLDLQISMNMELFVDYENNTVSFVTPEFISILEWVKKMSENRFSIGMNELYAQIESGEITAEYLTITSNEYFDYFLSGRSLEIAGIPVPNGNAVLVHPIYRFYITGECADIDEATEFIDYIYDDDMQNSFSNTGFYSPEDTILTDYGIHSSAYQYPIYDFDMMAIIREESEAFFDGQKTAEECASIIQSRASILMSER